MKGRARGRKILPTSPKESRLSNPFDIISVQVMLRAAQPTVPRTGTSQPPKKARRTSKKPCVEARIRPKLIVSNTKAAMGRGQTQAIPGIVEPYHGQRRESQYQIAQNDIDDQREARCFQGCRRHYLSFGNRSGLESG